MAVRRVLITGASSGFGKLTAEAFAREGWRTFATMRNPASSNAPAAEALRTAGCDVVEMDVTNDASVDAAAALIGASGALDVLVNNAGVAWFGVQEAFTPQTVERLYATNVFGPLRVNRAFLPAMRERRAGLVVYISSVVGRIVGAFGGVYASSKWALEALAEASSYELAPFGIDVSIIQPGAFPTPILGRASGPDDEARAASYGEYRAVAEGTAGRIAARAEGQDSALVADAVVRIAQAPAGERPLRTVVPENPRIAALNDAHAPIQREMVALLGVRGLLPKNLDRR